MISKMRNGQLKKMLFCLTPLQRERVILFYWERFSCPEIDRNGKGVQNRTGIIKHQESKKEIEKRNT